MSRLVERVDRLETVFAAFMERTEEALADIRASTAEIRASNARTDAILLEMHSIPEFLPEYASHQLVPVVASVTIEASLIPFLNRERVYGVAMGDETMELVNLGQF